MKPSEILNIILERYPANEYKIGAVKQIAGRNYVTVTVLETEEKIRVEIDKDKIIERGEGYTTEQFNDNDGKIELDEKGNIIDDSHSREDNNNDAR